jgi:hypothetical protein
MKLYERFVREYSPLNYLSDGFQNFVDDIGNFFREFYTSALKKPNFDSEKNKKSIEDIFKPLLEEHPEFELKIGKGKVTLVNKNYGVKNA